MPIAKIVLTLYEQIHISIDDDSSSSSGNSSSNSSGAGGSGVKQITLIFNCDSLLTKLCYVSSI